MGGRSWKNYPGGRRAINTHVPANELLPGSAWRKSSYSDGTGNSCVEFADAIAELGAIGVRDSKDPSGPALTFTPAAWTDFVGLICTGRADFGTV